MITVHHRFLDYQINPDTETLILGTFNPDTDDNPADFFYGRSRNYLWRLLPLAFNEADLKGASKSEKQDFIKKHKIDLIDLISEIKVEEGQEANYNDGYIDNKVTKWKDVIAEIDKLNNLKRVCFTRKTFSDIPNIKRRIEAIQKHCEKQDIEFKAMITPARIYSETKQTEWTIFSNNNLS